MSQRVGRDTDSAAIAASALQLYNDLSACLVPIIGVAGVTAISSRSIYLATRQFPWLAPAGNHEPTLAEASKNLKQQSAVAATDAAVAVLDHLVLLLTTFIGTGLTTRLLQQAWPDMDSKNPGERER